MLTLIRADDTDAMSFADRLLMIRRALQSERKPLAYPELETLILERTGKKISRETLRQLEIGNRVPDLSVVEAIAAVDPLQRGRVWLAWGADGEDVE